MCIPSVVQIRIATLDSEEIPKRNVSQSIRWASSVCTVRWESASSAKMVKLFEKHFCGMPLRIACILTGVVDIVFHTILGVLCGIFHSFPNLYWAIPWVIIVCTAISMLIGAYRRSSYLFWPYVIVKYFVVAISLAFSALCFSVAFYQFVEYIEIENGLATFFFILWLLMFACLTTVVCILNFVPALIVRNLQTELRRKEKRAVEMTAKYEHWVEEKSDCVHVEADKNESKAFI